MNVEKVLKPPNKPITKNNTNLSNNLNVLVSARKARDKPKQKEAKVLMIKMG